MALKDSFWRNTVDVFNIGSEDQTNVVGLPKIVMETMGLKDVMLKTSRPHGGRAWPGDVRVMQLDVSRIKGFGWRCRRNSEDAVRLAAEQLTVSLD
jgi:hypothetical protein